MDTLYVELRRNGLLETRHPVTWALVGPEGTRVSGPDDACFFRSACKPLQLLTSIECLQEAGRWEALSDEELALGASSHSGEEIHVRGVRALQERLAVPADGLRCGAHAPTHAASARALIQSGQAPQAVHNNCSGKHTFMLAAAAAQGWDLDYLPLAHPLQQRNLARMEAWMGTSVGTGVDGCGVPTFHGPVVAMARAWAGLAEAARDPKGAAEATAGGIVRAMARHPHLVSGTGRLDAAVMDAAGGKLTGKVGAEGLFCIAVPALSSGLAIKVWSGDHDALAVAVRAVLDAVLPGWAPASSAWPWGVVLNVARREVGARVAAWRPTA